MRQAAVIGQLDIDILKMHQMQVVRGTRLADEYAASHFRLYTPDEYIALVSAYVEMLRPDIVLERFVSQCPAHMLVAPRWNLKNHEFTDRLVGYMKARGMYQGRLWTATDTASM